MTVGQTGGLTGLPREPTRGLIEAGIPFLPHVSGSRYFPENQLGASLKPDAKARPKARALPLPREPTRGLIEACSPRSARGCWRRHFPENQLGASLKRVERS